MNTVRDQSRGEEDQQETGKLKEATQVQTNRCSEQRPTQQNCRAKSQDRSQNRLLGVRGEGGC